ncbi:mevalonate kinase [Caldivirga sp. UBA161]|uniref:mevalonate kinase n=1 Tax=Caldivirga sp. UBA161 TaxID=1915569 RepID=UPI0025C29F60|nr:mevalonate kinase [Caldivirga sp. UBA161]
MGALKVTATAPGVVKLFGEHAVVYGKPAIAMAINKGIKVTVEESRGNSLVIFAKDLEVKGVAIRVTGDSIEGSVINDGQLSKLASYALTALRIISGKYGGDLRGIRVIIESQLPIGAGLATSAAVSVATAAAYARLINVKLSKEDIAKVGHSVELTVQGAASPMDTAVSSIGGVMYIKPGVEFKRLSTSFKIPLVVGYVERELTTGELVKRVKALYDKYPKVIEDIMNSIGAITDEAVTALSKGDYVTLGELMNINQGLLEALGVSNHRLSSIIYMARKAGALGAKLSGGGGGGAMIALAPGVEDKVAVAVKLAGGEVILIDVDHEGVHVEDYS